MRHWPLKWGITPLKDTILIIVYTIFYLITFVYCLVSVLSGSGLFNRRGRGTNPESFKQKVLTVNESVSHRYLRTGSFKITDEFSLCLIDQHLRGIRYQIKLKMWMDWSLIMSKEVFFSKTAFQLHSVSVKLIFTIWKVARNGCLKDNWCPL